MGAEIVVGEPVDLFEFLRTVAVATYRGKLTKKQAALAVLIAVDSAGTTGTGVTVQASNLAVEVGISPSQVWRQFGQLRDAGWFEQTSKPARGARPGEGRRARYRCTVPPMDLGLLPAEPGSDRVADSRSEPGHDDLCITPDRVADSREDVRHDRASERVAQPSVEMRRDSEDSSETCRSFDPERVAVLEETCRIPEPEKCDSLPSNGSPSDGYPSPVVDQVPQPQDAREDPEAERRRQLAELEALMAQERGDS